VTTPRWAASTRPCARRTSRSRCGPTRPRCSTTRPACSAAGAQAGGARRPAQGLGGRLEGTRAGRAGDPDLALLHGDPEFERLYPAEAMERRAVRPEARRAMIGQPVSHYRITSKLGQRRDGVCTSAEAHEARPDVALKFLPARMMAAGTAGASSASTRGRARPRHSTTRASAPSTRSTSSRGSTSSRWSCSRGETLAERIRRRVLRARRAARAEATQIADALVSAPRNGRGAPASVSRPTSSDAARQAKILDFGLPRSSAPVPGASTRRRRPPCSQRADGGSGRARHRSYMSPVSRRAGSSPDSRTDLFSLGPCCTRLATGVCRSRGRPPPSSSTRSSTAAAADRPSSTPRCRELAASWRRRSRRTGELRYQRARDLKTDLARLRRDADRAVGARPRARTRAAARSRAGRAVGGRALFREPLGGEGRRVPARRRDRGHSSRASARSRA